MADRKIPIDEATDKEIFDFASVFMGLDVHHNHKRESLLAKIQEAGWGMAYVTAPDLAAQPSGVTLSGSGATRTNGKGEEEVQILINATDKAGGDSAVFVSVNGSAMYIPRGTECWVPVKYVEALKQATELIYDTNEDGSPKFPPRVVKSYPFQLVA